MMKRSDRYAVAAGAVCLVVSITDLTHWAGPASVFITLTLFAIACGLLRTAWVWRRLERDD